MPVLPLVPGYVSYVTGSSLEDLRDARVDFALARPDRIVFGAGDAASLPRVRGAFDRWLGG